jgi:Putative peptidoglycan binding domain
MLVCAASLQVAPAHARTLSLGDRNLKQGMHGRDVRVLQDFLTKVGIRTTVDGQYGPGTANRVRRWERKSSLQVDGRMSRKDSALLRGQVDSGAGALQGNSGGSQPVAPAGENATLTPDGLAVAPASAPPEVQQVIQAANAIVGKPYRYGGGHGKWEDSGYDCSGSESYALHGADLIDRPMDSTEFMSWGEAGEGTWITSYANSGHSFLVVAGLRFDTGYNDSSSSGPKWSDKLRPTGSYTARHPEGL